MKNHAEPTFTLLAKTLTGLENVLAGELATCGASEIQVQNRAVSFQGSLETLYRANLELRTASRILKPVATFQARNEHQLYRAVYANDWLSLFDVDQTFAVDSVVASRYFTHSKYVALKVKDAIVDHFRKKLGSRPSIDVDQPDVRFNMHISDDVCTLSLDSSGDSLHKRGYRLAKTEAPLNEVLAAGLILLSEWDTKTPFVDPMCGSGTLLIEAGLIASQTAPGLLRKRFGFMHWQDFDARLWQRVREEVEAKITKPEVIITGGDKSGKAFKAARENIERAGLNQAITLRHVPFEDFTPPAGPGFLIMNPPYGERMQERDLLAFYRTIGDRLKQGYTDYEAWILSGNQAALKHIGLRASQRLTLYNGAIECKFHRFLLYKGSVKSKYQKSS